LAVLVVVVDQWEFFGAVKGVLYDVLLYGKLDAQRDPRILCENLDPIYTRFAHVRCTGGSEKG